ncbi:DUF3575 domain-containing protein [Taibaiella lutea]|uniref:DUF3575 domain-containing protein n=1 Tax=Taibaiella lutea TaxID=2608001 RepID=A0A5M6CI28_9BACT|nr:DUF3575 domain-containing protein [Taibaiella lutea]KAA5534673.1 DUF3575 domain-containing protein [Taibaiella lutea]
MKKTLLTLILLSSVVYAVYAAKHETISAPATSTIKTAENDDEASADNSDDQMSADITSQNIVKMNFSSLVVKNFSFQYERVLVPKLSACLGIRFMPKSGLPFSGTVASKIEEDDDNDDATTQFIKKMDMGGWAITPELRYYFGRGNGKGFYAGLFVRYERFDLNSVYVYKDDNNVTTNIGFDGHYSSAGVGLMIGSQFMLSSRFTLDWWILGPYYAKPKVELSGSGFNLSDKDRDQLNENLNGIEIDFSSFKTTSVVSNTTASLKVDGGSLPLVRGFGLCLGFRF